MQNRIKEIRKSLGLNQTEFGEKIGVKQTTVAGYENGSRQPLDAVISLICREFHVNERWLRTGEGEMFIPQDRNSEIAAFVGKVMSGETDSFKSRFISALSQLDENDWVAIEEFAKKLSRGE